MKENTVVISLEHYNNLRDFKRKIEDGKVLVRSDGINYMNSFVTRDEAVEIMNHEIKFLLKENKKLKEKIREMSLRKEKTNKNYICELFSPKKYFK